ncbi:MAG: endolytic transglycosylase MltG [Ruminococcus sp.]|nr:endolytic transglycosylase MltG [Ruminococcus sp.]MBR6669259.1 endolytic transglycosylase MltG [Ruminococcus sp.]
MPKDNDSLINDILNELANKSKDTPDNTNIASLQKDEEYSEDVPEVNDFSDNTTFFEPQKDEDEMFIENALETSEEALSEATDSPVFDEENNRKEKYNSERLNNEHHANRPVKKKKKKKQRNRLPGVLILTTLIFAISISLSLVIIAFGKDVLGIGKSETTQLVVIPEGASTQDISLILEREGIIKSPKCFQLFAKLGKKNNIYIAGEHFLRPNMAYETIIQNLTTNANANKEVVEVTFPEGITLVDASLKLEEEGVCSADEFMFYFNAGGFNFEFENKLNASTDLKFYRMEGFFFPDTYFFYKDMTPEEVCQKIYLNFDNKMTDERYAKMETLNLSLDDLVTFASVVQAEAPRFEDMKMVASVFWNRLNNPDTFPKLESDPTSKYANNVIKPHMDVYDNATIEAYDTYSSQGLPPGAICNPGIEAIDAVLAAIPSENFFFYANIDTKITYFAKTNEEHEANIAMVKQQYEDAEAAREAEENE